MTFYDRESEIDILREIEDNSHHLAQMTLLMGRRRVGKTTMLKNAYAQSSTVLYFFVAKKNEVLLCEEFVSEVEEKLSVSLGSFHNFAQLFKAIMIQSQSRNFTLIVDEFGKDYGNYFSILTLIASSKTSRAEIEGAMNMPVGGYLERLENDYNLIKRIRPFGAKEGSRNNKYLIDDNFLNFWFRFIYKYRSAIEIGNFDYVRNIVERDYETYSGLILEKYFRAVLIEAKQFSEIGNNWNKKGEDEIDIIALNDMEKRVIFYEVKRNKNRINIPLLEKKSQELVRKYQNFHIEYKGFSLENM